MKHLYSATFEMEYETYHDQEYHVKHCLRYSPRFRKLTTGQDTYLESVTPSSLGLFHTNMFYNAIQIRQTTNF